MDDPQNEQISYLDGLLERTTSARTAKGWTQEFVASALGIPLERYKKYETRSALPLYLIERFCLLTDLDPNFLVTGKGSPIRTTQRQERRRA